MTQPLSLMINGNRHTAKPGSTVLVALNDAGIVVTRTSVSGDARAPLCGMGVCFECRVTVNGRPQTRACMMLIENNMDVMTCDDKT